VKELRSYEKEIEREVAKTAEMKDKGADPYDLKQQVCIPASNLSFFSLLIINAIGFGLDRKMCWLSRG
jgi:hypothetical protein